MTAIRNYQRAIVIVAAGLALIAMLIGCSGRNSNDEKGGIQSAADELAAGETGRDGSGSASSRSRPVDSETLAYADVNDKLVYGYFAFPTDMVEPLPAVIVVHDWWGLNDDTRSTANRLAAEGYMVLAIDLYGGETVSEIRAAREKMITVVEDPRSVEENISQALEFVAIAGAPGTAALGWGFGGSWSLSAARLFPEEIDAAVIYYGQVPTDEDVLRPIKGPILGLFGAKDRGISPESVAKFEAAMERLRKPVSIHMYPQAGHAFADPARTNYDEKIAEISWRHTVEFLAQNLSDADQS